jgi:ketosteroid isomerase-like protein
MELTRRNCLTTLCLGGLSLAVPSEAQDPAKDAMRTDVLDTISKFVQAANSADIITLTSLISNKPEISFISDGTVLTGPEGVSQALNKLVGSKGKYQLTMGVLNVANINGLALATGPCILKDKEAGGTKDMNGAVSILLENQGKKKWIITHIHRSTQSPEAAGAAAP